MHRTMNARAIKTLIPAALFLIVLTGCSMGPQVLKGNRFDYNVSIQRSNNEELLLNIIRARYVEPLFFLQVGSISSSFGQSATVGVSGSIYERALSQTSLNVLSPSLGATVSENPTITYSPLQGERMVRQLQAELRLDRFLVLARTGFSIDAMLWLTVLQIGDLGNFRARVGTEENRARSYEKFLDLARLLNTVQMRGDLEFTGFRKREGEPDIVTMQLRYLDGKEAEAIENLLGVRPERIALPGGRQVSAIELTSVRDFTSCREGKGNCSRVFVKLKSYHQIIYDMAMHVDVSDDTQAAKSALPFKPPTGELASRDGIHSGLLKVRSQAMQPMNAFVAVPYRSRWYYIDDEDVKTKVCFMILSSIYSLQSGDLPTTAPVLTLPVGR